MLGIASQTMHCPCVNNEPSHPHLRIQTPLELIDLIILPMHCPSLGIGIISRKLCCSHDIIVAIPPDFRDRVVLLDLNVAIGHATEGRGDDQVVLVRPGSSRRA